MDKEKGIIIKHGKEAKVSGPVNIEDAPKTPEPIGIRLDPRKTGEMNPFALRLMPWEKWWKGAPIDFMRRDPEEANHPLRIRMGKEAARVGGSVLDVGCGTAIDYPRLRDLGFDYWAIEPMPNFKARAEELHPDIRILQERCWDIPFDDNTFDVVWCKGVVQHLPTGTYPEALDELWRVTDTLLMVSTNRVFLDGDKPGVTQRKKGHAYNNHYNFKEFNGHVKRLPNSISRHVKGFVKAKFHQNARETGRGIHTLFIIYNKDYWKEHINESE